MCENQLMKLSAFRSAIFSTSLLPPLCLLAIYITLLTLLKGSIPPAEEIINHLEGLYGRFGYEIIFLGAFLEGALIVDLFIPGASIVLFGAIFSRTGQIEFPLYLLSAFLGFTLGFLFDYLLGYLGFSSIFNKLGLKLEIDRAKAKLKKIGGKAFLLGYFHPDIATVFVTAAGIIRLPLKEFMIYNAIAGFLWLTFWSSIAYFTGEGLIALLRQFFLAVVIAGVLVWLLFRVIIDLRKKA